MKKIFSLMLLGAFFLTACQGGNPSSDEVKKMAFNQEKRIGLIQSLGGAYTSNQATHLLRMADGKNLQLKSSALDLKNEKYAGKEVEVMGEIIRTTDGNQVMEVRNIDILDTDKSTMEELPQWVDYSSDSLGLNLKYRDDYLLREIPREISIRSRVKAEGQAETDQENEKNYSETLIKLLSNDENFDLAKEMGVDSLSGSDLLAGKYNRSKITQKALESYKKAGGGGLVNYYLQVGGHTYLISFIPSTSSDTLISDQNMFYDILASIDFSGMATQKSEGLEILAEPEESPENQETSADAVENEVEEMVIDQNQTEKISGFEVFKSESQNFSLQYPKSYYFGSMAAEEGAIRSYEFGSKPLEEQEGEIKLSIVKTMPNGKSTDYNGKNMTIAEGEGKVSIYVEANGKIFVLTSSKSKEGLLKQMASTIQ